VLERALLIEMNSVAVEEGGIHEFCRALLMAFFNYLARFGYFGFFTSGGGFWRMAFNT